MVTSPGQDSTTESKKTSIPAKNAISHRTKQTSKVSPKHDGLPEGLLTEQDTMQPQPESNHLPAKKSPKERVKNAVTVVKSSGDFLGRLGTLAVMVVTTISHTVVTVSTFGDDLSWKFFVLTALLLFVHVPVTVLMIWVMCKARVKKIYKKVRPSKSPNEQPAPEVEVNEVKETQDTSANREANLSKIDLVARKRSKAVQLSTQVNTNLF